MKIVLLLAIIAVGLLIIAWFLFWYGADPHVRAIQAHMQVERNLLQAVSDSPTAEQCEELRESLAEMNRLIAATPLEAKYSKLLTNAQRFVTELENSLKNCPQSN